MTSLQKRSVLPLALASALALTVLPVSAPAHAAEGDTGTLTVLATTDVHGRVYNWDYFKDSAPAAGKEVGLANVCSAIEDVRAKQGAESVLLVDNGDAIQGSPLTYLAAKQPAKLTGDPIHPMAQAFNLLGYDANALGNHEFNYGLDTLAKYMRDLDSPALNANAVAPGTTEPYFEPYELIEKTVAGKPVTIGVLGLVTPGVRIWDKANVEGTLEFRDPTEVAREYVPQMKEAGADIIVVLAHTGMGQSTAWDASALDEDTAQFLSTQVDDIDLLVIGHTHKDEPVKVTHTPNGEPLIVTQPKYFSSSLPEISLPLVFDAQDRASVAWPTTDVDTTVASWVTRHAASGTACDALMKDPVLSTDHADTVGYVKTIVANATEQMPAGTARYEDTAILDFIGKNMEDAVRAGVKGTAAEGLPVIAQVSPFSKDAVFPKGPVSIKDIAGLYIYDNTLLGVEVTGSQIKDYLEYSAKYFKQLEPGATLNPDTDLNAVFEGKPVPDYNYDALTGVTYTIDVTKPVGERIVDLAWNGAPVTADQRFVMAINNYRQSGGGGYPHVTAAPIVYNELVEIRQLLIDSAQASGTIDPKDFFVANWSLTPAPLPEPEPGPQDGPTAVIDAPEVVAGATVTVTGTGFEADHEIEAVLHSDPFTIGKTKADAKGTVVFTFAVPKETAPGAHKVILTDASTGAAAEVALTVKAPAPAPAPGAVTPGKGKGAALANTGSDAMSLILAAGLLAGLGAVALRRRVG